MPELEKHTGMARFKTADKRSAGQGSNSRFELTHRQLRIVAGELNGRCVAIAYQGGRKFLEEEASDVSSAITQLKKSIDDLHDHREAGRTDGIPSAEEYADALHRIDRFINPVQHMALVRHANRPGAWASLRELARQIGTEPDLLQRAYARVGRYVGDILNFCPEAPHLPKAMQPILVIAEHVEDDGEPTWILRPNFVSALENRAQLPSASAAAGGAGSVAA